MSFTQNLSQLRSLVIRTVLILGVCVGGLTWVRSYGDPDFTATVEKANPPIVQLSFFAPTDCYYAAEYWHIPTKTWTHFAFSVGPAGLVSASIDGAQPTRFGGIRPAAVQSVLIEPGMLYATVGPTPWALYYDNVACDFTP